MSLRNGPYNSTCTLHTPQTHRIISHLTAQHHLCTSSAPPTPAPGGITRAEKDDFIEDDGGYKIPKRTTLSKIAESMIERECEHSGLDDEEEEDEEDEVEEVAKKSRKSMKRPVPVFMEEVGEEYLEESFQSSAAKRRRIQRLDSDSESETDCLEASTMKVGSKQPRIHSRDKKKAAAVEEPKKVEDRKRAQVSLLDVMS